MKKAFSLLECIIALSLFFMAFLPFLSFQRGVFHVLAKEARIAEKQEDFYNALVSFPLYGEESHLLQKQYYHEQGIWNEKSEGALWQSFGLETEDKKLYRVFIQTLEGKTVWETWISKERWNDEKQRLFPSGVEH